MEIVLTALLTLLGYSTVAGFFFYKLNEKTIREWREEHDKRMTEWREEHSKQMKEWKEEHREDIKIKWEKIFGLFVELKLKQDK